VLKRLQEDSGDQTAVKEARDFARDVMAALGPPIQQALKP
jgi:hypothetical protein